MAELVLAAEARFEKARSRAEDPSIASDAAAIQLRLKELDATQHVADRLYPRWAELEAKQS